MKNRTFTRLSALFLAAITVIAALPAVWAGEGVKAKKGADPVPQTDGICEIVASLGVVADQNGIDITQAAAGATVTVSPAPGAFDGHVFSYWKAAGGTVIPSEAFTVLVDRSEYFYPVFSDVPLCLGQWELIKEGTYCQDGDLYSRVNSAGVTEYKKVFFNEGYHYFDTYEYVDENTCRMICSHCGYTEDEQHNWSEETVIEEATHGSEGLVRRTCYQCGATVDTVIPRTDEHVYDGQWTVVEPSVNGQYGKRSRKCLYCDHTETYWYLEVDFKSLFKDRSIRYKETYGGKLTNNEQYYSWTREDGKTVYIFATQYVYSYSTGNDNAQSWAFMFIDDGDPTVLKPVYLSKTSGGYVKQCLWAHYGLAYDFDDWFHVLRSPDFALPGFDGGPEFYIGNTMSARASVMTAWSDDWAEEFNNMMIPASDDPDSWLTTTEEFKKWQAEPGTHTYADTSVTVGEDENGSYIYGSIGGFTNCTSYKKWVSGDGDSKVYDYITVDNDSGVAVSKIILTTAYTTREYYDYVRDIVTPEEYDALDENVRRAYVSTDGIADELKSFFSEQGRNSFNSFTLEVPDPIQAVRVLAGGYNLSVSAPNWARAYGNDAKIFFTPKSTDYPEDYALTFTWTEGDGRIFDRWESYDFYNKTWVTVGTDTTLRINTYPDCLREVTLIRSVSHVNETAYTVKATGGTVYLRTSSDETDLGSEASVPENSWVYPVFGWNGAPDGMEFDKWMLNTENGLVDPPYETYNYRQCVKVTGDLEFVPTFVERTYYVDAGAENGYVYLNGEEYHGENYTAGTVLTFTTEGYVPEAGTAEESYPYFYGWYEITWEKDGEIRTLVGLDEEYVYTVSAGQNPTLRAIWGSEPTPPEDPRHDITVVGGFASRSENIMVDHLRLGEYGELLMHDGGFSVDHWILSGDGMEDQIFYDPYIWIDSSFPENLTVTGVSVLYGDVNDDGTVDTVDLTLLRQYLADSETGITEATADVNCSGLIDTVDLTLLRQYLADGSTVLGPNA